MNHLSLNSFIEDTCVLVVIAYLFARGRMLDLLLGETQGRNGVLLGLLLGLVGCTEVIFPGDRSPYMLHTLIVSFATLRGGIRTGLIATATVLVAVALLQTPHSLVATALVLGISVLASAPIRYLTRHPNSLPASLLAGMGAQAAVILLQRLSPIPINLPLPLHFAPIGISVALLGIPANGFGIMLLQLVVQDAQTRAASERHRLEAERAHALAAEAQLAALRARVHPHFLFNALTSIAALCGIAPERAEHAITRLSLLMRCALQADLAAPQSLRAEIEYTQAYLEIEQHRFGARLQVDWNIEPQCEGALVPQFTLQTLVENAVGHGIAPRPGVGHLSIHARAGRKHVLVAVRDDGAGIEASIRHGLLDRTNDRPHGLQLVSQQLMLLYGRRSRPRILSAEERGTLVAFAIPYVSSLSKQQQRKTNECLTL